MSTPQQPELHRSGRSAADPRSAKAKAKAQGATTTAGDRPGHPRPEDNVPGHHPTEEQDRPVERYRRRAEELAHEAHEHAEHEAREAPLHDTEFSAAGWSFPTLIGGRTDGDPVVLLHGFPQVHRCWVPTMERLIARDCRVVAPLQRGYAATARPPDRDAYRLSVLVDDVLELATGVGFERFHLVGHDWGGVVGWALAASFPERLHSFTSVSTPHPAALAESFRSSLQALRSSYVALFSFPAVPDAVLRAANGWVLERALGLSGLPSPWARDYARFMATTGALTPALDWYRSLRPADLRIGPVHVPTLFVWGPRDTVLGPAAAKRTGAHVSGAYRFEALPGTNHWIPESRPDALADLIVEHVRRSRAWVSA
jgi:pimeloyl-ACP methyl ester carboxylesterase